MATCGDCRHFETKNGEGLCKVKHPEHIKEMSEDSMWPKVKPETRQCGEFLIIPGG